MGNEMYRILVTGWRNWPKEEAQYVWSKLYWTIGRYWSANGFVTPQVVVVHGQSPYGGVDLWADQWAWNNRSFARAEPHPASRGPRGELLGPARNSHMVALGANVCLAFPGPNSRGTVDCMKKAREAGIETFEFPWKANLWAKE